MIALTSRLNERDETIIQLQEELDAYDRIHKETEQVMDMRQGRVQQLEDFIREQCGQEPPVNPLYQQDDQFFQVFNAGGFQGRQDSLVSGNSLQDRKYPPFNGGHENPSYRNAMLTADEKVQELSQVVEQCHQENEELRQQLEQIKNDKIAFVRDKINDLVHKEVQLKLNNMALNESQFKGKI